MEAECVRACPGGQIPDTARRRYCTIGGVRSADTEGLSLDELELEDHDHHHPTLADHDHGIVGAAREEVDFLDEDQADEFFQQERELLSFLQNP